MYSASGRNSQPLGHLFCVIFIFTIDQQPCTYARFLKIAANIWAKVLILIIIILFIYYYYLFIINLLFTYYYFLFYIIINKIINKPLLVLFVFKISGQIALLAALDLGSQCS